MTREIKFRGKRLDNGEWVFGDLLTDSDQRFIFPPYAGWLKFRENMVEVDPATVGQYIGLEDKNGLNIWEGDLIRCGDWHPFAVEYGIQNVDAFEGIGFNLWDFYENYDDIGKALRLQNSVEVVGNIHDNPELIKIKGND